MIHGSTVTYNSQPRSRSTELSSPSLLLLMVLEFALVVIM